MIFVAQRIQTIAAVLLAMICIVMIYLVSLKTASARAELSGLERGIVAMQEDIHYLEAEYTVRSSMAQLAQWNVDAFGLSAPQPAQYVSNQNQLASLDRLPPISNFAAYDNMSGGGADYPSSAPIQIASLRMVQAETQEPTPTSSAPSLNRGKYSQIAYSSPTRSAVNRSVSSSVSSSDSPVSSANLYRVTLAGSALAGTGNRVAIDTDNSTGGAVVKLAKIAALVSASSKAIATSAGDLSRSAYESLSTGLSAMGESISASIAALSLGKAESGDAKLTNTAGRQQWSVALATPTKYAADSSVETTTSNAPIVVEQAIATKSVTVAEQSSDSLLLWLSQRRLLAHVGEFIEEASQRFGQAVLRSYVSTTAPRSNKMQWQVALNSPLAYQSPVADGAVENTASDATATLAMVAPVVAPEQVTETQTETKVETQTDSGAANESGLEDIVRALDSLQATSPPLAKADRPLS